MTDFTEANRKYFEYSPFERCSVGQVRTLILFFFFFLQQYGNRIQRQVCRLHEDSVRANIEASVLAQ